MPSLQFHGKPLTDGAETDKHAGPVGRKSSAVEVAMAQLLESQRALLDRLVGVEEIRQTMQTMIGVQRPAVLWSGMATIGTAGWWHRDFRVPARGLFVVNFTGNAEIVISAGAPANNAPGPGVGTHLLPAGVAAGYNNETNDWTLYGTPGQSVDVQVFGTRINPSAAGDI